MHLRAILLGLLLLTACSSGAAPAPTPPPAPPPALPASQPCAADADCRLFDYTGCSCGVALVTETVPPNMTPCFAPPCMDREAFCDVSAHRCAIRPTTPPVPSTPASTEPTEVVAPPTGMEPRS
jgi:hypothetical protein